MLTLQVIPDRFAAVDDQELGASQLRHGTGLVHIGNSKPHVRRPTNGIVLKDETFATLRVVAGDGGTINLVDAGSKREGADKQPLKIGDKIATDVYSNFFLQAINEERMEKQQIIETFGEPYIFLFGERARIMSFQGVLLNTFDFNWEAEWWYNYDNYIRGTKCVENDARVYLSFDETLVSGYVLAASASKNTQERNWVNFQFQLFVTSYATFSSIGSNDALQGRNALNIRNPDNTAPFRPTLIDPNRPISGQVVDGQIVMPSLAEGIVDQLDVVTQTWNRAQEIVGDSFTKLVGFTSGLVRVPVGFEGTLVFDEEPAVNISTKSTGSLVVFSTFQENEAEYIGISTHYGSSVSESGVNRVILSDPDQDLTNDQKLVERAQKIWRDAGFIIPPAQIPPVAEKLVTLGVGMLGVGATSAWREHAASQGEVSGAEQILANGIPPSIESVANVASGRHGSTDLEN